ncbi:MAG: 7,8-dihydropterin-6-yl-methyl-4-(beta-D-ribofuranosyl)aminobenzene 5'-phosphate synthase [Candidatus Azotimanducaceae bacterium]|jgi:7,8-dihydropterin-6-yl-methyl-4-(beta-D-ribofuranosyl)aminobenzene 5'-phosphate synthase
MLANFSGDGEWGFSALIETQAGTVLFDTGFKQTTVWNNSKALNVDLSAVNSVILTHYHTDHTGGLLHMRKQLMQEHPNALSQVYVGKGFFQQRFDRDGKPVYSLDRSLNSDFFDKPQDFRRAAEALGICFTVVEQALEILPGVHLTGPIKRQHDERNVSPGRFLDVTASQSDNVPESQVVGLLTAKGWLLVSGCGHAGIVNATVALRDIRAVPVVMGVGGFHLFRASTEVLDWTAEHLRAVGMESLVGAHCTGTAATYHLKEQLNLPASKVSIGAVGTRIDASLNIIRASVE